VSPGDICNPPVADRTSFLRIGKGEVSAAPSQNLAGYEVLTCDPSETVTLKDKFTIAYDGDSRSVRLRDPSGKEIASSDADGFSQSFCSSAAHRIVVAEVHGQVGGDCDEVGGEYYVDITQGMGPETYTVAQAKPGTWKVGAHLHSGSRSTVKFVVILFEDTPREQRFEETVVLEKSGNTVTFVRDIVIP